MCHLLLKSVDLSLNLAAQKGLMGAEVLTHLGCLGPSHPGLVMSRKAAPRVVDAWRDCLSPENENRCRQSLGPNLKFYEADKGRKAASQSQGKDQGRWASVLVSLCSVEGQPSFLFTLRSSTLKGRHKGDVSFAGGKSDPSDRDVVATALREAWEELGIHVGTEKSGMKIAPVLANLGPIEELSFKPNPGEVEEIFTLSLSHLCNPQNCGYTHFRTGDKYGYTLPVFRNGKHREVAVEGPAEGEEIQGLAALLLSRRADGAAGLEDATLRAALGQEHPTHQPLQGFEASQLHQHLDDSTGAQSLKVTHQQQEHRVCLIRLVMAVWMTVAHRHRQQTTSTVAHELFSGAALCENTPMHINAHEKKQLECSTWASRWRRLLTVSGQYGPVLSCEAGACDAAIRAEEQA
ncbi:hypothetical protein INR49_015831 [Caranx melampygus]|nr:hypothetical protein INR49_015831 [Caranx melampygus]